VDTRLDQFLRLEQLGRKVVRMPGVWRLRVLQQLARMGVREEMLLIAMAGVVGVAAAGAAWCFEQCVDLLQTHYLKNLVERFHLTGRWILLLPLLPALGGLAVSFVRLLFRRAHSTVHGLSAVLLSLIRDRGKLRHTLGLEMLMTSALTIGTGGSAGPEAPIAIIGSSVGSIVGTLAGISRTNSATLIGCGAAAGISAVFDAPIAGILFALEVMLRDFSVKTFTPIVISAVLSTTTFHAFHSLSHAETVATAATTAAASMPATQPHERLVRGLFELPASGANIVFDFREIPNYIVLGIICGLLGIALTWLMEECTHVLDQKIKIPPFFQPAIGAGLSGLCGVILILLLNHAHYVRTAGDWYVPIFGSGYTTIMHVLDSHTYLPNNPINLTLWILILLSISKLIATSLTLGGGGSGGVFAPALFIGATAGGALGMALQHVFPGTEPSAYALIGMGSILAAVIQAPLMGIILLFELTRNYQVMLPIMLSGVTATVLFRAVMKECLYTIPLTRMGVRAGAAVGIAALRRIGIDQLPHRAAAIARPGQTLSEIVARSQATGDADYVITDEKDEYLGLLNDNDIRAVMLAPESAPLLLVGEVMRTNVPPLKPSDTLEAAWDLFARYDVDQLAIVGTLAGKQTVSGMVARADLMKRYHDELGG
jgi:CIC family chloride channel protein